MQEAYVEKRINDIDKNDRKVAVSGCIVSTDDHSIMLDDGDSRIAVFLGDAKAPNGRYMRVFGRVIPCEEGIQLHADLVQDLSNMDLNLYKKMLNIMKQRGV